MNAIEQFPAKKQRSQVPDCFDHIEFLRGANLLGVDFEIWRHEQKLKAALRDAKLLK